MTQTACFELFASLVILLILQPNPKSNRRLTLSTASSMLPNTPAPVALWSFCLCERRQLRLLFDTIPSPSSVANSIAPSRECQSSRKSSPDIAFLFAVCAAACVGFYSSVYLLLHLPNLLYFLFGCHTRRQCVQLLLHKLRIEKRMGRFVPQQILVGDYLSTLRHGNCVLWLLFWWNIS